MTAAQRFHRKTIHTTLSLSAKRIKGQQRQGTWESRTHLARQSFLWATIVCPTNIYFSDIFYATSKHNNHVVFRDTQIGTHPFRLTTSTDSCMVKRNLAEEDFKPTGMD